jgi:hypothetical protein
VMQNIRQGWWSCACQPPVHAGSISASMTRAPRHAGAAQRPDPVSGMHQTLACRAQVAGRGGTGRGMTPTEGIFGIFGESRASAIAARVNKKGRGRAMEGSARPQLGGMVRRCLRFGGAAALAAIHARSAGPYWYWMVKRPARRPGEARRGPRPPRSTVGVATRRTPARPRALVQESGARSPDRGPHGRFVTEAIKIAVCDQMVQA